MLIHAVDYSAHTVMLHRAAQHEHVEIDDSAVGI